MSAIFYPSTSTSTSSPSPGVRDLRVTRLPSVLTGVSVIISSPPWSTEVPTFRSFSSCECSDVSE